MKRSQIILLVFLIALGLVGCKAGTLNTDKQPSTTIMPPQNPQTQPTTTIVSPLPTSTQPAEPPIISSEMLIGRTFEYKNRDLNIWMQISFSENSCGIMESPYVSTWPESHAWQLDGNVLCITTDEGKTYYFLVEQDAIIFDCARSDEFVHAPELPDQARFTVYGG